MEKNFLLWQKNSLDGFYFQKRAKLFTSSFIQLRQALSSKKFNLKLSDPTNHLLSLQMQYVSFQQ